MLVQLGKRKAADTVGGETEGGEERQDKMQTKAENGSFLENFVLGEGGERTGGINPFGFGVMGLGVCYPTERPSAEESIKLIHLALDQGVRFFDTVSLINLQYLNCSSNQNQLFPILN
jgi:hypothetical protein